MNIGNIREQLESLSMKYQQGGKVNYYIRESYDGQGKLVPTMYDQKTNQKLSGQQLQEAMNAERNKNLKDRQTYERTTKNPLNALDLTGITNWGDAKRGLQDLYQMTFNKNVDFKPMDAGQDVLDVVSALPFLGKRIDYGLKAVKTPLQQAMRQVGNATLFNTVADEVNNSVEKSKKQYGGHIRNFSADDYK